MFCLCLPIAAQITGVIPTSVNTQSGGTYTLLSSDNNKLVNLTGSSPAVTLPTAGGSFPNGWHAWVTFNGTGTAVLTPASGTIDGASSASITASAGAGLFLTNNGSNWFTTRGTGGGGGGGGGGNSSRGSFASRPTCDMTISGEIYYSTDSAGLQSQCNGTSWADFNADTPITLPGVVADYTTVNGGTLAQSGATLYYTKNASGLGVNLIPIPAPSSDWDLQMAGRLFLPVGNMECGLWTATGTTAGTDNAYGLAVTVASATVTQFFQRNYIPINGSLGDTGAIAVPAYIAGSPVWFRLTKSGTTITSYMGDGTTWQQIGTFTASSLTHYGFGCDPRTGVTAGIKVFSLSIQ